MSDTTNDSWSEINARIEAEAVQYTNDNYVRICELKNVARVDGNQIAACYVDSAEAEGEASWPDYTVYHLIRGRGVRYLRFANAAQRRIEEWHGVAGPLTNGRRVDIAEEMATRATDHLRASVPQTAYHAAWQAAYDAAYNTLAPNNEQNWTFAPVHAEEAARRVADPIEINGKAALETLISGAIDLCRLGLAMGGNGSRLWQTQYNAFLDAGFDAQHANALCDHILAKAREGWEYTDARAAQFHAFIMERTK